MFFDPGTNTTMLMDEYPPQRTLDLYKNRCFRVFMKNDFYPGNVPLTWHKQTNKQRNPFNFFHMTLPSVEGTNKESG